MNRSTEGSVPRRRLEFGGMPASPFELLSPISRFDETDFNELSPFVHNNHHLNGTSPRLVPSDTSVSNTIAKQRRRCSEIVIASPRNGSNDVVNGGFPTFSTSHWLSALFEWIYVTFSEKKHQEMVLKEIVQSLTEMGVIPFNITINSEQLIQIQQVIDSLRLRIWQDHNKKVELTYPNGMQQKNLLPFAAGSPPRSSHMKHSLTFAGASLARFALAAQRPSGLAPATFTPRLPLPLSALFPAGRYKNDFVEQEQLGRGGFGVVVKAVNCFDGTAYAIKKVFVKNQMVKHDQLLRSLREVRAASSLNHPNIVRYYSAWIETVYDDTSPETDNDDESGDDSYKHSTNNNNHSSSSNFRQVPSTTSLSDEFDINHQLNMEFEEKKKKSNKKTNSFIPTAKKDTTDDDGDIYFYDDSEPSKPQNNNRSSQIVFQITRDDSDEENDDVVVFGSGNNRPQPHESRLVPVRQRTRSERRSPSLNSKFGGSTEQPSKVCLYIQMELCTLGTLADWLTRRNNRTASLSSSPPTFPYLSSPPRQRHSADMGFVPGSPTMSQSPPIESLVNASWNASVFLQIVRGLAFVHSRGVIHRDLKPANIFLTGCSLSCPEVKLGDFGLTRFDVFSERGDQTSLAQGDLMLYEEHRRYSTEVGTRAYASPEQVTRKVYTRQSDMFSLGLILYELYRPFATTMERLANFEMIRKGGPDDLDVLERYPETWRLIKRLTDQCASKRPNCTDLLAELETNEVDRLREVVEQQRREIERLRQAIVVDSPSLSSRFSLYSSS